MYTTYMYINTYNYIYKFTRRCHSQTTLSSERRWSGPETCLAPSADKQTATMTQSAQTTISPYKH